MSKTGVEIGLDAYLDRVFDCVAWQIARNRDTLPAYFLLPPPIDAAHWNAAQDILTDFVICEFDSAPLPEIRFHGRPRTTH
jgi:hypothetical protein